MVHNIKKKVCKGTQSKDASVNSRSQLLHLFTSNVVVDSSWFESSNLSATLNWWFFIVKSYLNMILIAVHMNSYLNMNSRRVCIQDTFYLQSEGI